jgi:2-methylcitrate dehydratase PrpD
MTAGGNAEIQHFTPDIESRRGENLTREVACFVIDTTFDELPQDLLDLSRKSLLDGLGLALSGSVAESGHLVQEYLLSQNLSGDTTVIGTSLRMP